VEHHQCSEMSREYGNDLKEEKKNEEFELI
jgi:hypothetical protein